MVRGGQQDGFHHIAFPVFTTPADEMQHAIYSDQSTNHVRTHVAAIKRPHRRRGSREINDGWDKYVAVSYFGKLATELAFDCRWRSFGRRSQDRFSGNPIQQGLHIQNKGDKCRNRISRQRNHGDTTASIVSPARRPLVGTRFMFYPAKPGVVGISDKDLAPPVVDSHGHTTRGADTIMINGDVLKKNAQLFWIIVALGNRGVCRAPGAHKACDHGAIGIRNLAGSERLTSRA